METLTHAPTLAGEIKRSHDEAIGWLKAGPFPRTEAADLDRALAAGVAACVPGLGIAPHSAPLAGALEVGSRSHTAKGREASR
jgi:hypothetical protein